MLRGFPPEQVFAQTLLGFETVRASMKAHDDTWVGINFVMPEDGYISMRDYTLQMQMLDYLHSVYPEVHISLHAGELAPGLVPPEGLRFHIRQAVELGHAERIGHGVDVMYEDNAPGLLKELAQNHVMVEINLSSNEGILGIEGDEHPLAELPAGACACGALDRRRRREPHRHHARICARGAGLPPDLPGLETDGAHRDGAQLFAGSEPVGAAGRLQGNGRRMQGRSSDASEKPSPGCKDFLDRTRRPLRSGNWNAGSRV